MNAIRYYTLQLNELTYKYGAYHPNTLSMYHLVRILKSKSV